MCLPTNFLAEIVQYQLLLIVLLLWETVWKAIAMWKAARNNHLAWYICLLIFNTVGVLPIIYILLKRKKETQAV
ncbi:MAG TPA: DUF5652 family protein [Paludibacteraceae bacterium]|nr:DUF5652 family protein [Paludibacteraceae bacterium]HPO67805.1 DUF5652 family protein [Paludibacteraceae bacterium]